MEKDRLLRIYLNDHLAASLGMRELVERCRQANSEGELGTFLQSLGEELKEDRETLKSLLKKIGGVEDPAKSGAAWFMEKVGRLKFNGHLLHYSDLSRLEELEALILGLRGKERLWSVLEDTTAGEERWAGIDFSRLREKVVHQIEGAQRHHREAALKVFVRSPSEF